MQEETRLVLCVLDGEQEQKDNICSWNDRKGARIRIKEKGATMAEGKHSLHL